MTIQILTKRSTGKKFIRICIDTPKGLNEEESIGLIPITPQMSNDIISRVASANYQCKEEKNCPCIELSTEIREKFDVIKIKSL